MFPSFLLKTCLVLFPVLTTIICSSIVFVNAQGLQQTPYSAADSVRRGLSEPPDMSPSNPLGLPGSSLLGPRGSDSIPISSGLFQGLLPNIPNLQLGYIYNFGQNVRAGRATLDYLLPVNIGNDSTIYGEAHGEFQSFWKTLPGSSNNRTDLSLGGGYRRMLNSKALVGINGFYDTSRLYGYWYSSGSAGLEFAAEIDGNDAVDLNFNWYGRLFNTSVLRNALRYGPSNYDFQVGYSHELWSGGPDLRLSATGYKFQSGSNVYGYYAGAELKSRDGMFVLKYDVGHDRLNKTYQSVGAFINIGLQLENLLSGNSPLTMPEPIFKSPRNIRRLLTKTSDRNWYQPTSVVVNRNYIPTPTSGGGETTPTPTPPNPPTPTPDPPTPDPPTPTCNSFYRTASTYYVNWIGPGHDYWGDFFPSSGGPVSPDSMCGNLCMTIAVYWAGYHDTDFNINIFLVYSNGDHISVGTPAIASAGITGTFSVKVTQDRFTPYTSLGNITGLYMTAEGGSPISINYPEVAFNQNCSD